MCDREREEEWVCAKPYYAMLLPCFWEGPAPPIHRQKSKWLIYIYI